MKDQIQLAKDTRMTGYLTKPYRKERLRKETEIQIQSFLMGTPTF